MTMTKALPTLFFACLCGCTQPAPRAAAAVDPPAEPTEQEPAPSVARADALLEDMRRREAAYQKAEREAPKGPAPDEILRQHFAAQQPAAPVAVAIAAPPSVTETASAPSQPASNFSRVPERDETWWKDRMRALQTKLEEDQRLLIAAEAQVASTTLRLTYDQATAERNRLIAAVASDRAAIASLEEEARRAGIPPGWLRP
jgi:hypothetical protein